MAGYLLMILVVAIGASVAWYFVRQPERGERARFLRMVGLVTASVFGVLAGSFIAGEAMTDPGG